MGPLLQWMVVEVVGRGGLNKVCAIMEDIKMSNKKTRLILLNNPTASLFMASWFVQKKIESSDWRNVTVNICINRDAQPDSAIASSRIFQGLVDEAVSCNFNDLPCNFDFKFGIRGLFKERRIRSAVFKKIRTNLKCLNILNESVKEIWVANSNANSCFKVLFPCARILQFEHGNSDIIVSCEAGLSNKISKNSMCRNFFTKYEYLKKLSLKINPHYIWKYFKNKIKELQFFLEEKILFFRNNLKPDVYVSIFGNEIERYNKNIIVEVLQKDKIFEILKMVTILDANFSDNSNLAKGKIAIILVENPADYIKASPEEREIIASLYCQAFETYFQEKWCFLLQEMGIKSLFFKGKYSNKKSVEQLDRMVGEFNKSKVNFNCFSLQSNPLYSLEYYLPSLNPLAILGGYSSGLLYAKKMLPHIEVFTYDDFFIGYIKQHFPLLTKKDHMFDSIWVKHFYEGPGREVFLQYIPKGTTNL